MKKTASERELLDLAAKAAKYDVRYLVNRGFMIDNPPHSGDWNPFRDDGAAMRLAVRLHFLVQIRETVSFVTDGQGNQLSFRPHKPHGDAYAATRYAIVRAAAELGKAGVAR